MSKPEFITVTITAPDPDQLASICRTLIEERLAACANIDPQIHSIYRWDGVIEQRPEALAVVHTRAHLFPDIADLVTKMHPYEVPQLVALPVSTLL